MISPVETENVTATIQKSNIRFTYSSVYIVSYTKNQPKSESVILPDQPSLINIVYSNKWYNLYKKVNRGTCSKNISYSVSDITDSFVRPWLLKTEDIELIEKSIDADML